MKFASRIAIISTLALTASAGSAFAFGGHHGYGGSAKYLAGNFSKASGTVKGYVGKYTKGYIETTNVSEQYNNSYQKRSYGFSKVGGESGSFNQINTKWKNVKGLSINSNTAAAGFSGTYKKHY